MNTEQFKYRISAARQAKVQATLSTLDTWWKPGSPAQAEINFKFNKLKADKPDEWKRAQRTVRFHLSKVLSHFLPYINNWTRKKYGLHTDYADILQEATIGFYKGIEAFDTEISNPQEAAIRAVGHFRMQRQVKEYLDRERSFHSAAWYRRDNRPVPDLETVTPESIVVDSGEASAIFQLDKPKLSKRLTALIRGLAPKQRAIANSLREHDYPIKDIAAMHDVKVQDVYYVIRQLTELK